MKRLILGFVVAAFAFPVLLLACGGDNAVDLAATTATLTVTTVLLFGLPAFAYFRRHGWWKLWRYLCGGGIAGAFCVPFVGGGSTFEVGFMALFCSLGGIVHAALFWAIAIWGNEKLTCPTQFRLPCGTAYRYMPNVIGTQPSLASSLAERCWRHPHPS